MNLGIRNFPFRTLRHGTSKINFLSQHHQSLILCRNLSQSHADVTNTTTLPSLTNYLPTTSTLTSQVQLDLDSDILLPPPVVGHLFSDSSPIIAAGDLLHQLHDALLFFPQSLTWTATILTTTLGIRLFVGLPVSVFQQKSIAKLQNLQPEFKQLGTDIAREVSIAVKLYNWDDKKAKSTFKTSFKKHWRTLVEENNCHPLRAVFLTWLQMPFWIGFSCALRNIVFVLPEPRNSDMILSWVQMASENPLWIHSLATPDPFILPGIFLAANLINLKLHSMRKLTVPQTKLQKSIPWIFGIGVTGISVFAAYMPAALSLYWATSSVAVLIQNIAMKTKPVRRFFKIPPTPTQP